MQTVNTLKKLIKSNSIIPIELDLYGKYYCKLLESKSDYVLEIKNPPSDTFVIKCDNFPETTGFFQSEHKECKKADYILISSTANVIFIIELKRSKDSSCNSDIIAQLKGAKCVLDYCESIVGYFFGNDKIFSGYDVRYYKSSSTTQKRSFKKQEAYIKNDLPEQARKIMGESIQFNKLLM